jgi:hypothetical protein
MSLYTVRFATRKIINRYDDKRRLIGSTEELVYVTHTALPYAAAMSYSAAAEFSITEYFIESKGKPKSSTRVDFDAARSYRDLRKKHLPAPNGPATRARAAPRRSAMTEAARTGDLSAAINEAEPA